MNVYKRGFTLMELLVVISIIGLLASVVLSSLNTVRAKARDSKRIQEMKQVQNALALFESQYQTYPGYGANYMLSTVDNTPNVVYPAFIPSLPVDPNPTYLCSGCSTLSQNYRYQAITRTGTACNTPSATVPCDGYILITKLESKTGINGCYMVGGNYDATTNSLATALFTNYGGAPEVPSCSNI